jgi:hypothetical protein
VAFIVLGSAVVFAGVGVAGLLERAAAISNYNGDTSCPGMPAPPPPGQCTDYVNTANTWTTVSVVSFVGSGIALAAGITIFALSPSRPAASATLSCAPGLGGVSCAGAF